MIKKNIRIIPRLDIKGTNLVKGIHLEGLRVLGDPEYFAHEYYKMGADELIYQDVVASLYQRNSILDQINKVNKKVFIPLSVGGGIRKITDIKKILSAGADKVVINTAAIKDPDFITNAARIFGSSTIVISIEVSKERDGNYYAFTDNGRERTGKNAFAWAKEVEKRHAGEILLTSVDRDGTGTGFDENLVKKIAHDSKIPIIAHGGASNNKDIIDIFKNTKSSAVAISSMLHYSLMNKDKKKQFLYKDTGNLNFIKSRKTFKNFGSHNMTSIKNSMKKNFFYSREI